MSDTGKAYYISAREEIVQRVKLRDQIVLSYIIAVSAFLSIALQVHGQEGQLTTDTGISYIVMLIIPFITLGASVLVSTHSHVINTIGRYFHKELIPEIERCRKDKYGDKYFILKPWETSKEFSLHGKKVQFIKLLGQSTIMIIPPTISLFMTHHLVVYPLIFEAILWWIGALITVISVFVLYGIYKERSNIHSELRDDLT